MVLVVCLSPSRTGIDPRSIRVGFAVNKVATEEVYVRLFRVSVISLMLRTHISFIYHRRCTNLQTASVAKKTLLSFS